MADDTFFVEESDSDSEKDEEKEDDEPGFKIVKPSTVPNLIVDLKHSFGYDCKRLFNLCLIDEDTLIFASGNLLHYYSISRNEFTLRRTVFGGGVGFILKNHIPEYNYLTIAENGSDPTVFIYKYPEHDIISQLKGGAVQSFTTGVYSNNGEFLGTQAGHPDFMLTIWNWQTNSIVLRSKAYQNDVLSVTFSQFNPHLLASCGMSHVQFWKMAETFTGLKLKSDLGRFGKTDTSDIYAVYMLADEKVISGSEWGNMLVWEGGLIKLEVTRKARRPCHTLPITRIFWMGNNEVMTAGMDGYVRIWFWETVELADPPEEDRVVEIDPIYEFRIGDKDESCESRHLTKSKPFDDADFEYYSQDGKGGVWRCDLNTIDNPNPPVKLFSCHGGKVVAAQASPISSHIATLGEDGKVNIYNYETEKLLLQEPFSAPGGDLIWLDTSIDPSGAVMIVGFGDGVVRQVAVELQDKEPEARIHLICALKPHAVPVTCLSITPSKDLLVSCALDKTAFLFHVKPNDLGFVEIIALGFLLFEGSPLCLHWDQTKPKTGLIGCQTGEVYECELPAPESIDLVKVRPTWRIYPVSSKMLKFKSVKSRIRDDLAKAATLKRKAKKLAAKKKEIKRLLKINPGLQIDESALADSSEEDEAKEPTPLYIPHPPNPVLWLQYTQNNTIWLSMGGYDAGYIYEVRFGQEEPVSCTIIPEADDIEIHSYVYIDKYLVFGMQTGQIRVNLIKPDFRELTDFWVISMHDNLNGVIPRILTSRDGKWFFSVGHDGNVFYYYWNGPIVERTCEAPIPFQLPSRRVTDIEDPQHLSFEEVKMQENLVKLRAFEEEERRRLKPSFEVMQLQVDWLVDKTKEQYQAQLNLVLERLKSDVSRACRDAKDLYDSMFLPLEYVPFEVYAVSNDVVVRAFRLPILVLSYAESIPEEEEGGEEESRIESGVESRTTFASSKGSHLQTHRRAFIYDFAEKVLLKIYIRILEFFVFLKKIKTEELERIMELCGEEFVDEDELEEPTAEDEDVEGEEEDNEDNEEEEKISWVERAIGFLNNSIKETVEVKTLEIGIYHEMLYHRKAEFNNKVIRMKTFKTKLYEKYERLKEELTMAEENIDLPPLRELVMYHEYPDVIFREPFIPLRSFESILWEKPMKKTIEDEAGEQADDGEVDLNEEDVLDESVEGEGEEEILLEEEPSEEWLVGTENLYAKINEKIFTLDEELSIIACNRTDYEVDIKYLSLLLEISENELIILQDSELTEKYLVERDEVAKGHRSDLMAHIKRLNNEIAAMNKSFVMMQDDIKGFHAQFYEAVRGNKFFKFLKRIFEKKFKPQKEVDPEDEGESESSSDESSSDEDADAASADSGDMTAIRLDESHCPTGLDRKIYDLAFELRSERHSLEQKMYDGGRSNDIKRAEIEELTLKLPEAEENCRIEHTNLMIFRHKKDEKLRAVETAVIYNIEGFGLDINETEEETDEYHQYLETIMSQKTTQLYAIREELRKPTESYTDKLRVLLEILEERDRLRRKKPSIIEAPPSEKSISIATIVRPPTPPPPFDFDAYADEKILKLVTRFFVRYLAHYMPEAFMRKCIPKVARILANIGRHFTCELADNIIEVIVENIQRIIPKKYLVHASLDDVRALFKDIVSVFEQEPVEVNPIKVISAAVENGIYEFVKVKSPNKTQRICLEIAKVIVEELPMDDLRSAETPKLLAKLLAREAVIIPNCLNVEILVEQLSSYAKAHMLSAVTVKIIRSFAKDLLKELISAKVSEIRAVKPRDKICRDVRRKKRPMHPNI